MTDPRNLYAFIKNADPVSVEPKAVVSHWTIYRVTFSDDDTSEHLVGLVYGKSGRTTSAIQTFDGELGQIITSSGRKYTLFGPPKFNIEADYVWKNWKLKCEVIKAVDISDLYAQKIRGSLH